MSLIFDEKTLLDQNIFKYESRLKSATSRFLGEGALLTKYYNLSENRTTVDRGLQSIDQLFGNKSPLRFNCILNFPIYGTQPFNPANDDSNQIEDINVEGEAIILPSTIMPQPNDFFMVNHLKMKAVFRVIDVQRDAMKVEGYYKIKYYLYSTSDEVISALEKQTVNKYNTDLNSIGTQLNPIIKEDDFVLRSKIKQMIAKIIESYKALFYSERHNCFLFMDPQTRLRWFDLCGNEFISKHNLMNTGASSNVIVLSDKLRDEQFPLHYNNSIYNWIEIDAPLSLISPFFFNLAYGVNYKVSSFALWNEKDIRVMLPEQSINTFENHSKLSFFTKEQIDAFNGKVIPQNDLDKILYKFINGSDLTLRDIPLTIGDGLLMSMKHKEFFFFIPILLYIFKQVLRMN